jgi:hypothetical protein
MPQLNLLDPVFQLNPWSLLNQSVHLLQMPQLNLLDHWLPFHQLNRLVHLLQMLQLILLDPEFRLLLLGHYPLYRQLHQLPLEHQLIL